jgi:hypothetical protein
MYLPYWYGKNMAKNWGRFGSVVNEFACGPADRTKRMQYGKAKQDSIYLKLLKDTTTKESCENDTELRNTGTYLKILATTSHCIVKKITKGKIVRNTDNY